MKYLFLINPAAGKKDHTKIFSAKIQEVMTRLSLPYEIKVSEKPGDITEFTRQAAETGEEYRVFACGGDGTLNEAVNGAVGHDNVAVTHYPGGSGNDFIKIFSSPETFLDLEALVKGTEAKLDLIRFGDRYAINICSVGLDARIGTGAGRYKRIPLVTGSGAYLISVVVNLIKGVFAPYTIELPDATVTGDHTMICVCSGRWYGGGFNPIPEAEPDDGMLDILLVAPITRLRVAGVLTPYKKGQFRQYPELFHYVQSKKIRIRTEKPTAINLDGELIMSADAEFEVVPNAIRFFYPAGLTYHYKECH